MLYFLISCVSFILLSKSFTHKPIKSSWVGKLNLLSTWLWGEISSFLVSWFRKSRIVLASFRVPTSPPLKNMSGSLKVENVEEKERISLLDLPDLTLECIFERLSPVGLCSMAGVCTSLREKCTSDHLWKKHMKQRWDGVLGDAAYREWRSHIASSRRFSLSDQNKKRGLCESLCNLWPLSWIRIRSPKLENSSKARSRLPADSIMGLYLSLESGKFWFPAQVYNRENGHVGFMLSCYDALLSYDSQTDTFQARYSPHARRTIEDNIQWDRLRAPPIDTPPNMLHESDCLHDLKPGDHIEIQWRRNREFPYGWWYGVVGHLESCDGIENRCSCHYSEMVILEFNQYTPGSRWRRTMINRKEHREEGNEADGFYGGIRKLYHQDEISMWKRRWPTRVLD
ncbi:F-box protein At2g32560 isoform X2 [Ziziphus jujuba]|uniref:F-box protein At2g32560 isoform X2 n=1 Tax=Ziziphus jujuba TaxID=326968 RepID=A0ABM3ZWW1_ZIZJJ|nr:F-box protein At2g32560-like [Ziziphus jujuba var. spinosa]XP_060668976.1 F-box protein At2g32560 isoform X2 [Ziziphus jujuba]